MDDVYWASLPSLPKRMKWPVKVTEWDRDNQKALVYCHSDDANVPMSGLAPFPGNLALLRCKGIVCLKRKRKTCLAFTDDIEWALKEHDRLTDNISEDDVDGHRAVPHRCCSRSGERQLENGMAELGGKYSRKFRSRLPNRRFPSRSPRSPKRRIRLQERDRDRSCEPDRCLSPPKSHARSPSRGHSSPSPRRGHFSTQRWRENSKERCRSPPPDQKAAQRIENNEMNGAVSSQSTEASEQNYVSAMKSPETALLTDTFSTAKCSERTSMVSSSCQALEGMEFNCRASTSKSPVKIHQSRRILSAVHDENERIHNMTNSEGSESAVESASNSSKDLSFPPVGWDMGDFKNNESETSESDYSSKDPIYKPSESDMDADECMVSDSEGSDVSEVLDYYPAIRLSNGATAVDIRPSAKSSQISQEKGVLPDLVMGDTRTDPGRHLHSIPPEEGIVRDPKCPHIYIRKGGSDNNDGTKRSRVYDNYHCCLICKELKSNIRKHLLSHRNNATVRQILKLKMENADRNRKEIERLLAILRNAGDNCHNISISNEKSGELIVSRRVVPFYHSEYGPCSDCLEWIKMGVSATKHLSRCPASSSSLDKKKLTKKQMVVRSNVIKGLISPEASEQLVANVYPIMTTDDITEIAQADVLIVSYGNFVYRQNINNRSKRKYTTSARMRAAARLLQYLKTKLGMSQSMSEFLTVDYFDDLVEAALMAASPNNDDLEDLKHPSAAIKAGHDIQHMADIQLGIAVKNRDSVKKEEVQGLLFLVDREWDNRVGRLARKVLRDRRMLKNVNLPKPRDLKILAEYLVEKLTGDLSSYREAAEYSLCRLLLYNKRRSGELENTLLENYNARSSKMDASDESLIGELTELERKILGSQELMRIDGKGQQIVPVLIPADCVRALEYVSNETVRKSNRIKENNTFLFPTTGDGPVRAYDAMKKVCEEVGVSAPAAITSVNIRKYFATMTQVIGLKEHELGWLCKHLGHTVNVHKLHYRAASGYIERMNIGKLMLLQDFNLTSNFKGQRLDDIRVEDILKNAEKKEVALDGLETDPQGSTPSKLCSSQGSMSGQQKHVKKRWSKDEEKEIRVLFKDNLQKCLCPSKEQLLSAIEQSRAAGGNIHLRISEVIKKKVWNMYKKNMQN